MTFQLRLKKLLFALGTFITVWLLLLAWDHRGVPPREELEGMARGVGFALLLLLVLETVLHLVRRPGRAGGPGRR